MSDWLPRAIAVASGGALGALCRWGLSMWLLRVTFPSPFPWPTFLINVTGAFALGVMTGAVTLGGWALAPITRLLFAVGFLGAFTTFSTFAWEIVALGRADEPRLALLYVTASLLVGVIACWVGFVIGGRTWIG
ncbi:MAG: fluoride efflux transporter CrcB [Acidobacteriota bacterium]